MAVVAASFLARPGPALADANEVSISPAGVEVAPGGSTTVQLVADPPAGTLTIWAIDVAFDPDIVTTTSRDCDTLDPLPDSTAGGACLFEEGVDDTLNVLGLFIFNEDGSGLADRTVLADITFGVIGEPGQCSDLRLRVRIHTDVDANETNPLVFDGQICIEDDAPPSGTAVPHTPAPRTSEPTPTGGGGLTPPPLDGGGTDGDGLVGGGETPADGDEAPTNGAETPAGGTQSAGPGSVVGPGAASGEGDEDGGGDGVLIWALLAVAGLIVAAGLSWAAVRRRGAGSGPEGGSSAG